MRKNHLPRAQKLRDQETGMSQKGTPAPPGDNAVWFA